MSTWFKKNDEISISAPMVVVLCSLAFDKFYERIYHVLTTSIIKKLKIWEMSRYVLLLLGWMPKCIHSNVHWYEVLRRFNFVLCFTRKMTQQRYSLVATCIFAIYQKSLTFVIKSNPVVYPVFEHKLMGGKKFCWKSWQSQLCLEVLKKASRNNRRKCLMHKWNFSHCRQGGCHF